MQARDFQRACDRFEASLRLFRRASMLLNLGACNDELGKLATALGYWREGVSAMQIDDPRMTTAKAAVADLERRAPRVSVTLPGELPPEALVALDGAAIPRERLDAPLYVDPGDHELTLDAPGHAQGRTTVRAVSGTTRYVYLPLGEALEPDVITVTEPSTTQLVVGWVLGGIGVASITMGAVTGGLVLDRKATVEDLCRDDVCSAQAGVDAAAEGRSLAIASTVGFIAGGALTAIGIVLIVTASIDDEPALTLNVVPNGLALRGTF